MVKMVKKLIKGAVNVLKNSESEFKALNEKTLEEIVFNYVKLLVFIAIVAGAVNMVISFVRVLYLDIFLRVGVNYLTFLNYVFGQSSAIMIIYIMSGTFLLYFVSLILNLFFRRIKYTELLKKILYSLTPVLVFGWTPYIALSLLIYSVFLFIMAIKVHQYKVVDKKSIDQRD
jgi:phosphoglycerol transferase MdoB-like AlkP superfamily enzyme